MEITFVNPGADYMIQRMMDFQAEEEQPFGLNRCTISIRSWTRSMLRACHSMNEQNILHGQCCTAYAESENTINEKAALYAHHWKVCKPQITAALSDAFGVDCANLFDDIRCNVSLNPIEPRFLKEHCYDTFFLNSERGAIGGGIHEIIHFVWFYVWNELFRDDYDEYERPSLKWILSEMVVESVMKDERLSSINPYFPRENGGCIYPYFFDMMIDDRPILDTLDTMYRSQSIREFMRNSYAYCQKHEAEIRQHIRKSEG